MVKITVYKKSDGKPVRGAKVRLGFGGDWSGVWGGDPEHTDADGEAHIDTHGGRDGQIYVNDSIVYRGRISGEEEVFI